MTQPAGRAKKISLIAVGRSGSGKSSIGNVFLGSENHWDGPFTTGVTQDACTTAASVMRTYDNSRIYTDLPGIPNTNPKKTAEYYDACINELKKPHTAVLFCFEYTKIDVEDFELAELLFREMNKAHCEKILVINDRNRYFGKRPSMEKYEELAHKILFHTKINFSLFVVIDDVANMKTRISTLEELLENVEAVSSPELKNFDELGAWIDAMKGEEDFRREATKDLKNAGRKSKIVFAAKCTAGIFMICAATLTGVLTGGSEVTSKSAAYLIKEIALHTAGAAVVKASSTKKHAAKGHTDENKGAKPESMEEHNAALDKIVKELEEAKEHHRALRDKLKGGCEQTRRSECSNKERKSKTLFRKKTPIDAQHFLT